MKLVILSNKTQLSAFQTAVPDSKDWKVLCDNPRFKEPLGAKNIPFEFIDETSQQNQWREINAWSCDTASQWIRICAENKIFKDIDLASTMHHRFTYFLAHMIKNFYFSEAILSNHAPEKVFIFQSKAPAFPQFSGNWMLNYFLREACGKKGIPAVTHSSEESSLEAKPPRWDSRGPRAFCKNLMLQVYPALSKIPKKKSHILFGSLRHLSSIGERLKKKGESVVWLDAEFNFEKFFWCFKSGAAYMPDTSLPAVGSDLTAARLFDQMKTAFQAGVQDRIFEFRGINFSDFILNYFFNATSLEPYLEFAVKQSDFCEKILKNIPVKSFILQDDISLEKTLMAAVLNRKGIPVYAVSHATFATDFTASGKGQEYGLTTLFVQSEFEKHTYQRRGWNPEKIVITGTPRYDELIKSVKNPVTRRSKKINLLYIAASLFYSAPDTAGFIGDRRICAGDLQDPQLRKVIQAVKNCDVTLTVRPHNIELEHLWHKIFEDENAGSQVTLSRPNTSFNQALNDCDVLLVSYWSSVLIEGALSKKPVYLVDFFHNYDVLSSEMPCANFFNNGFARLLRSPEEMVEAIQRIQETNNLKVDFLERTAKDELYFLGCQDDQSTERVIDYILNDSAFSQRPYSSKKVSAVTVGGHA